MRVFVLVVLTACGRIGFDPSSSGDGPGDGAALCQARDVDVGRDFGCLVDNAGDVHCWGHNTAGQVLPALEQKPGLPEDGPPLVEHVTRPGRVALRAPATKVALGREFSCALLDDGEVWCWGSGGQGQLGDGLMANSSAPVKVALGNIAVDDLDAGAHTACARVTADHSLMCWGGSQAGQLGQTDPSPVPVPVPNSAGVANLDLGHRHNCATMEDGRLVCWGRGDDGQLGAGTVGGPQLVTVAGVGAVSHAAATGRTSCAVETDGDVMCFGSDNGGKLGDDGQTPKTEIPRRIPLSLDAVEVQIGIRGACARFTNNTVSCWGQDLKGDGTFDSGKTPRPTLLANTSKLVMSYSMVCAIEAGIVVCWGPNEHGQLGRGNRSISATPIAVDLGAFVPVEIGAGERHACARSSNAVLCWGANDINQIGDNANVWLRVSPTPVATGLATIDGMAVGAFSTCVWSGGTAKCWGAGADGVQTVTSSGTVTTALALGHSHGCEIADGTTVFCQGSNGVGQVGDGTTTDVETPVAITLPGTPTAIAAGRDHTCAISGGVVRCWGAAGTIGDGAGLQRELPTTVTVPGTPVAIVAGDGSTCALVTAGQVFCWGKNNAGECGTGDYAPQMSPIAVTLPAPATKLSMKQSVMCAQLTNGDVQCWGAGRVGQLGDGTATDSPGPLAVPGLSNASSIAAGGLGGCAILSSGLVCWGDSVMLGNGDDSIARPLPVDFTTCP